LTTPAGKSPSFEVEDSRRNFSRGEIVVTPTPYNETMKRTAKYRMYPNKTQERTLNNTLAVCCSIYNTCLEQRKMLLGDRKKRITRIEQQNQLTEAAREDTELRRVHSQVRQDPTFRVQRAFDAFFRRLADPRCNNPGYPRFKSRRRYDSFTYPQATGFSIKLTKKRHAKLRLGKIGSINIRYHRPIPEDATLKTCTVRRKNGRWYACLTYEIPDVPVRDDLPEPVGIDVGLENLFALPNGHLEENPRHYRKAEARLRVEQRKTRRMRKGSSNRNKQQRKVAILQEGTANRRHDNLHKITRRLVDAYPYIKVERLQIDNMRRNHNLAKSISDASWGTLFFMLDYKAEGAGGLVEHVNPRGTSQTCPCGEPVPKELKDRVHRCTRCGLTADRDVASAMVIGSRVGTTRLARGEDGDPTGVGVTSSEKREAPSS
ncbi:MAG: transposase, partial [Actinobacteria bacterium]|nr:transposase [Actinomycetota bacterium]